MNGRCEGSSTIRSQGCALASTAMLFSHLGVKHTPKTINECMERYACPLAWEKATELCTDGEIVYGGRFEYADALLYQFVVEDGLLPILGLIHREYESEHWVLLTGYASDGDYWVHDPDHVSAKPLRFSDLLDAWHPTWLIFYENADTRAGVSPKSIVLMY